VTEWWIGGDSYGVGGAAGDSVALSSSFSATPSGFGKPVKEKSLPDFRQGFGESPWAVEAQKAKAFACRGRS